MDASFWLKARKYFCWWVNQDTLVQDLLGKMKGKYPKNIINPDILVARGTAVQVSIFDFSHSTDFITFLHYKFVLHSFYPNFIMHQIGVLMREIRDMVQREIVRGMPGNPAS